MHENLPPCFEELEMEVADKLFNRQFMPQSNSNLTEAKCVGKATNNRQVVNQSSREERTLQPSNNTSNQIITTFQWECSSNNY